MQLAPGETASIESIATQPLSPHMALRTGSQCRTLAGLESQALLVDQADIRFLVVVPHRSARGTARLTLRPIGAASETIELGVLSESALAHIVPLASRAALQALASGAIELETRIAGRHHLVNTADSRSHRAFARGRRRIEVAERSMPNPLNARIGRTRPAPACLRPIDAPDPADERITLRRRSAGRGKPRCRQVIWNAVLRDLGRAHRANLPALPRSAADPRRARRQLP